jgi:hypothetical protein
VLLQTAAALPCEVTQDASPASARFRRPREVSIRCIQHQIQQIAFTWNIVIERHGARIQLSSDSSHGYSRQAVLVRNGDSGSDDSFACQTGAVPLVNYGIPSRRNLTPLAPQAMVSWFRQL